MKSVWVGTDWHVWSVGHTPHHPYQSVSNIRQLSDSYANDIQVDDVFIYLGDLCDPAVTDLNELKHLVQNIPGYKILVKGNHDTETDYFYRDIGFDEVCDVCVINQVAFSHFPLKVEPDMINVHGHLHTEKRSDVDDANHINAYREDYYKHPVEISELIQGAYDKWLKDRAVHKTGEITDAKTGRVYDTSRVLYLTDIFEEDMLKPVDETFVGNDEVSTTYLMSLSTVDTEEKLLKWIRQNLHVGPMGKVKTDIEMARSRSASDFDIALFVNPRLRKLGHKPRLMVFIGYEPNNPKPGFVHMFNYWVDLDDSVTWFEASWRGNEGIHEFENVDDMKTEILSLYRDRIESNKYTETIFHSVNPSYLKPGRDPQEILKDVFGEDGLVNESAAKINKKLYHISTSNLDGKILYPKIPSNYFTKNNYEENTTKRVCFAPDINKCLMGLSQNCTGMEFFVHVPNGEHEIYKPSSKEVPDSIITGELWITEPVKLKCIGKILVIGDSGKPGHPFKYGTHTAELYDWEWKWIESKKSKLNESFAICGLPHSIIKVDDQDYGDAGLVSCIDWFCDNVQLGNQLIYIKTTNRIRNLWAITEQNSSPLGGRGVDYSYMINLDMVPKNIDKFSLMKFICLFDILVTTSNQRTIEAGCSNALCAAIAYWYSQPYYDQLFELPEEFMHPSKEVQNWFNMIQYYQRTINDTAVDLLVRDLFWNKEVDPKILISNALKNSMIVCDVNNESVMSQYECLLSLNEGKTTGKKSDDLNEILMEPEDAHLFLADDDAGEKSQKPYKVRLSTDDEGVIAETTYINEDAYQLQGIDRDQQDAISKKYGIRAVGHETEEEIKYREEREKAERERKAEFKKKQKEKQLAKARKAKKKIAKKRELEKKKEEFKSKFNKKNEEVDISDIPYNDGSRNFFDSTPGVANADFVNETGYKFEMLDKVKFFDPINESADDRTLYPVYVLCVHTGTLLANAIKKATGSHFSHCTISFDSSLKNMYSFGRKTKLTELSNGSFVKDSIHNPPYTNEGVNYALYCIPVTSSQLAAMKKRLEYFVKNKTKFRYDFAGLFKNFFGIADNPEQRWFCSRFVADIINAGTEPGQKPMIREPSLMRPEDFLYTNFALYVTSGLIKDYDQILVDKVTKKLLRIESIRRAQQRAVQSTNIPVTESAVLDLNPYDLLGESIFNYQMATMDESAYQNFKKYLHSFKIKLDKDGNIIIHRREVDQLDKYFREANQLLKVNMKAGNEQGVVDQLCRVHYMISLINKYYLISTTKQNTTVKVDLKKQLIDLRSVMINVYQQYLSWVTARNPQFNFQTAYDTSIYSDKITVPKEVITSIGRVIMTML